MTSYTDISYLIENIESLEQKSISVIPKNNYIILECSFLYDDINESFSFIEKKIKIIKFYNPIFYYICDKIYILFDTQVNDISCNEVISKYSAFLSLNFNTPINCNIVFTDDKAIIFTYFYIKQFYYQNRFIFIKSNNKYKNSLFISTPNKMKELLLEECDIIKDLDFYGLFISKIHKTQFSNNLDYTKFNTFLKMVF